MFFCNLCRREGRQARSLARPPTRREPARPPASSEPQNGARAPANGSAARPPTLRPRSDDGPARPPRCACRGLAPGAAFSGKAALPCMLHWRRVCVEPAALARPMPHPLVPSCLPQQDNRATAAVPCSVKVYISHARPHQCFELQCSSSVVWTAGGGRATQRAEMQALMRTGLHSADGAP